MVIVGTGRQPDAGSGMAQTLGEAEAGLARAAGDPAVPDRDPNEIGVVFVHGVGSQRPGEWLLEACRPFLRLISAWRATTEGVEPENDPTTTANIDFSGASRPFVIAEIPATDDHPAQTWRMTEAWWAARVSPPSVAQMFRWLVPWELKRLFRGIVSGFGTEGGFFRLVDIIFLPLFLIPVTALVILAFILFRILRAIPWKPLQDFAAMRAIDSFLVDWFGDMRILLTDRVQAANIRARVAEAIQDCLDAGCGTIVVVGHSGGTIVSYMTLADEAYEDLPVATFITHGQALTLAWRLGHFGDPDAADHHPDRLYIGDRLAADLHALPWRRTLRWYDFWATHDPAPAGGFPTGPHPTAPDDTGGRSTRVFNRMSIRNDHGGYWDNDEEFVLPVARLIDQSPAGAPATSRFFPESEATRRPEHRQARVKLLQLAWVAVMVSAVVAVPLAILDPLIPGDRGSIEAAGAAAWAGIGTLVTTFGPLLHFFEVDLTIEPISGPLAILVGVVAMLAVYYAVGRVMSGMWSRWDERERQIALQPVPAWRSETPIGAQLGLCGAAALWLFTFAATGEWLLVLPSAVAVLGASVIAGITRRGTVSRGTPVVPALPGAPEASAAVEVAGDAATSDQAAG
jgi:hypothetical protein